MTERIITSQQADELAQAMTNITETTALLEAKTAAALARGAGVAVALCLMQLLLLVVLL